MYKHLKTKNINWKKLFQIEKLMVLFAVPAIVSQIHESKNQQENQRYTYRVLQTIQMKLILLCVWQEQVLLGSTKTALKFEYEI